MASLLIATSYVKSIHADSTDPVQILGVQVESNTLKVNDTFSISATILNRLPYPIYLTSGSCTPAFSVSFDNHVKQVHPNIACTDVAIQQQVDPLEEITISNVNKPGIIYQAVLPGIANANITIPYSAKNQTATDYSNIDYSISKSFQFVIHGSNETSQNIPAYVLPPLQQIRAGTLAQDVKCSVNFNLIIKAEDGFPACVKPETAKMLYERGWTLAVNTGTNYLDNSTMGIVSIQMVQSLINPGGPPIQLILKNIGTMPITSLNATLVLNNDYNFNFHEVSESQPLVPDNSTSDTKILIGGGFTSDATYPLTINGIANKIPFSFTQNVHIPYTNENITTRPISENNCGQFYTISAKPHNGTTVPAILMNSNSTGCARLTYTINYDYNDVSNDRIAWPRISNFSLLRIDTLKYTSNGDSFGVSTGKDYTNSFKITSVPETIDLANYPIGSNFTVTYVIKPLSNATGFYDESIPEPICSTYPLAVNHSAGEVNSSDFSKGLISMQNHSCISAPYELTGIEISGMSDKVMQLP